MNTKEEITYGSAYIKGFRAEDSLYFNKNLSFGLNKLEMFMITE
jgi:hypothetical protein